MMNSFNALCICCIPGEESGLDQSLSLLTRGQDAGGKKMRQVRIKPPFAND